ncbi:hypothetical protein [Baaleninema simplex]|uniref:hypothetical protein n=1 Tax=Baaleninema simplex TaxID=2862350 RepID=UPI00034687A3|nr:hypothetical protein [Baaleninema simplex]
MLRNSAFTSISISVALVLTLPGCTSLVIDEYEATALTTYTWRVPYEETTSDKLPRYEEFASNSVLNVNGERPEGAVGNADEKGLWWPKLPPRPTVENIEARETPRERPGTPELLKTVEYYISYEQGGRQVTLPTDYASYRQAVRAREAGKSLKLTLGVNDRTVEKAEPL